MPTSNYFQPEQTRSSSQPQNPVVAEHQKAIGSLPEKQDKVNLIMEKYSRWRDSGTGIQPFLPPVPQRTESSLILALSNVIHYTVGPIQGFIKMTLVTITALLYFVFVSLFGTLLTPLGPLGRLWNRFFTAVLIRLTLFFSGFFYIQSEGVLRKNRASASGHDNLSLNCQAGDVIISNWTSYIDVLYLAYRFCPVFTQVIPSENKVRRISLWEAIRLCSRFPALSTKELDIADVKLYTVKQLAQEARTGKWGPVVVFPEGTTTNGRALLQWQPIFKEYNNACGNQKFHVLAFRYDYNYLSPTFTVGNQLWHYARLCSQFSNTLTVKFLLDSQSLLAPSGAEPIETKLINALGQIGGLRKTNLSLADKRDFLEYYQTKAKAEKTS